MENLNSSTGSLPAGSSPLDNEKIQKLVANYQKLKTQNAVLKKAIISEQQKSTDLDKDLKEKEQALVTAMQEHDVLEFNNQRLTKRLQTIQDQMNEKKEGGFKLFGGSKVELQKKEDEINLLRHELQERIDDNQNLHSVTNEKEIAFKMVESNLKQQIFERDKTMVEKDKEIDRLLTIQKDSEEELKTQTQSLRSTVTHLISDMKRALSSIKLRDDLIEQINELVKNCINNTPVVTIDYPLENITPSNERISFESLVFDKEFNVDTNNETINSLLNVDSWKPAYRNIVSNVQTIFSQNLTQLSSLIGSHHQKLKTSETNFSEEVTKLNDIINKLTLEKEENAFNLNSVKDDLSQKEQSLNNANRDIRELKDLMDQLSDSNREYELQIESEIKKYDTLKQKLEKELEETKTSQKNEVKQLTDQHQGLLKHQKNLMNTKSEEQRVAISQLEKKVNQLQQQLQQQQQQLQQQRQSPPASSSIVNLMDDLPSSEQQSNNISSPTTTAQLNSTLSPNGSLIDLSFFDSPQQTQDSPKSNTPTISNSNNNTNNLIDLDDNDLSQSSVPVMTSSGSSSPKIEENIVVTIQNQNIETTSFTAAEANAPSGRFKLNVLDETGEHSDTLNFSFEDKEREKEMKIYYENKITQLLNKISNIDAKALRYYEQYQVLLKKGQTNENVQKELDKAVEDSKNAKEELEITRINYEQQMKMITEQFVSLNESVVQLDSDLIRIKQHKVLCAKCKAWNPLENIFAPENHALFCFKGNHPIQTIQL